MMRPAGPASLAASRRAASCRRLRDAVARQQARCSYAPSANAFYHVLAFVPFTAPVAMPVLVSVGDAPAWQVAVAAAISLASTVWMARLAATIYSRAILRTGTRLRVRQALRAAA